MHSREAGDELGRMREQNLDRRLLIIALTSMSDSSGSFFLLWRRAPRT